MEKISSAKESDASSRRRRFSTLSSVFRSKPKDRASCIPDAVQAEPTCLESIHYPVYNPLDPRHNPEVVSTSWRRSHSSASETSTPISKIQTITRRSLHKARTGLQALRAGIINHFSEDGSRDQNHVSLHSPGREDDVTEGSSVTVTSAIFDNATFGAEIFRTSTPVRPAGNAETGSLHFVLPGLSDRLSFATVPERESKRKQRPCGNAVSTPRAKRTYTMTHDRNLDLQPSGSGDLEAKTHLDDCIAHTTPSIDDPMRHPPWGVAFSAKKENAMPLYDLAEPQSNWAGHWTTNPQGSSLSHASSGTQRSDDKLSSPSLSLSRQCSAEVKFAFPGVYQEMLEQCSRQGDREDPNELVPHPNQRCPDGSEVENPPNASPTPNECINLHDGAHGEVSSHEDDEGLIPLLPPQDPIPRFEELQPSHHPNPLSLTHSRHSSDRWSSVSEMSMPPWSRDDGYSSRYTTEELMSPDFGSEMTSMTNDTWSPLEDELQFPSPIEEENEYFLVDGKTSRQHRGNQPIKPAQPIIIDYNIPIEDRPLNDLTSPEILSPHSSNGIPGAPFDFEEDTDDEFYPGAVQLRRYY
ncbi:uncharacterized protein N7515_002671 [Penicillium bovifimosum]|uniref:Uncharacterized protein n=1 Tax=Penicillium bovifimosum TaxID=126998 RepID=A0A9W9HCD6_9EURO|nr:uncharacterized protein N7515_002671 [Penicillium bovifimosum]KAJ5143884.1 hypothetical protein N7515_002671 [Penicillium bovifimosum]